MQRTLDHDGFAVVPEVLPPALIAELRHALAERLPESGIAGVRALAAKVPGIKELAQSPRLRALVEPVLGTEAQLVRSVLFTKSDATNWHVAWHQDLTIAVQRRVELAGFVAWTEKDGVQHVQPPVPILERMLTVRVHLDATDTTNGALWVAPGSHHRGRLAASEAALLAEQLGNEPCPMSAGDVMLMRPLLLHASRKTTSPRPRRVIHLEFAGISLPSPLQWASEAA